MTAPEIRRLEDKELDAAIPILQAEGWEFSHEELERLRKLGGAVGAFDAGKLVGFTSFLDFEGKHRWVGNVAVAPDQRGHGVGAKLVENAMEGATNVGLYSVEKAVPLYERLGFKAQGEAWALRAESPQPIRKNTRAQHLMFKRDSIGVLKLDEEATGMDRGAMLVALSEAYTKNVKLIIERNRVVAYGIAKTSTTVTEIGPLIAENAAARDGLLDDLLQMAEGPVEITVPGANASAIQALEARGFVKRFRTVPMFKGTPPKMRPSMVAAVAGLEKG